MSMYKKFFFSLIISVVLLAGIIGLSFTGVFDRIEENFYYPIVTELYVRNTATDAKIISVALTKLRDDSLDNPLGTAFNGTAFNGTALFEVSTTALTEALAAGKKNKKADISICADPPGIVRNFSSVSGERILPAVSAIWAEGYRSIAPLVSGGMELALVSVPTDFGFYYGQIINADSLTFTKQKKILIFTVLFLTIFLIIFIITIKLDFIRNRLSDKIIVEQNGIHYINGSAFNHDENNDGTIDGDFKKLVESVTGKS